MNLVAPVPIHRRLPTASWNCHPNTKATPTVTGPQTPRTLCQHCPGFTEDQPKGLSWSQCPGRCQGHMAGKGLACCQQGMHTGYAGPRKQRGVRASPALHRPHPSPSAGLAAALSYTGGPGYQETGGLASVTPSEVPWAEGRPVLPAGHKDVPSSQPTWLPPGPSLTPSQHSGILPKEGTRLGLDREGQTKA